MRRFKKLLLLVSFIAYPLLLHIFIFKEQLDSWKLAFLLTPLLIMLGVVTIRRFGKAWWLLLMFAIAGLSYFILNGNYERISLVFVSGLSQATINLSLLWFFGRTLLHGQVPLITQIANHINGQLEPEISIYTRQVTIAWCIFFAMQVSISLLLYVFAPLVVWSFFINVLNFPLLMLMFIAEHTYCTLRYPHHSRTSIMKSIEVYVNNFSASSKADSRR